MCQGLRRRAHSKPRLRLTTQGSAASCGSLLPCSGGTQRRGSGGERTPALKTLFLEISVFSFISVPGTCLSSTGHLEQPVVSAGPPVHSLAALHSSSTFITSKPPANKAGRAPAGNQPFLWWKTTKGGARPPPAPQHPGNVPAQRPHESLCQNRFLWDTP